MAEIADRYNYTQPVVDEGDEIIIRDGRHPVLERAGFPKGSFLTIPTWIPRGISFSSSPGQIWRGKSTYLRQGRPDRTPCSDGCFVPASEAKIGVGGSGLLPIGAWTIYEGTKHLHGGDDGDGPHFKSGHLKESGGFG